MKPATCPNCGRPASGHGIGWWTLAECMMLEAIAQAHYASNPRARNRRDGDSRLVRYGKRDGHKARGAK